MSGLLCAWASRSTFAALTSLIVFPNWVLAFSTRLVPWMNLAV